MHAKLVKHMAKVNFYKSLPNDRKSAIVNSFLMFHCKTCTKNCNGCKAHKKKVNIHVVHTCGSEILDYENGDEMTYVFANLRRPCKKYFY